METQSFPVECYFKVRDKATAVSSYIGLDTVPYWVPRLPEATHCQHYGANDNLSAFQLAEVSFSLGTPHKIRSGVACFLLSNRSSGLETTGRLTVAI